VTLFGLMLTPVFYVLLRALAQRFARTPAAHGGAALPASAHAAPRED
jgi:multidrug efflux pump